MGEPFAVGERQGGRSFSIKKNLNDLSLQVKVEVRRRDLSTCHEGPVQQFVMAEGELII